MIDYALYHGDNFISLGTLKEISKQTNKTISTLKFYAAPSYWKRCATSNHFKLIKLDD